MSQRLPKINRSRKRAISTGSDPGGGGPRSAKKTAVSIHAVDDFAVFANDVKDAVSRVLPSPQPEFEKACVIGITFSHCDIPGVNNLTDRFLQRLHDMYGFKTERYFIDSKKSQTKNEDELADFLVGQIKINAPKSGGKTLMIAYFSGHGSRDRQHKRNLWIGGAADSHGTLIGARIRWRTHAFKLQNNIQWLQIMDCCNSGTASLEDGIELLGASTDDTGASGCAKSCFTQSLLNALDINQGDSVSMAQLLSTMLRDDEVLKHAEPIHHPPFDETEPYQKSAVFHSMIKAPSRLAPPSPPESKRAKVMLTVCLNKASTLPNASAWKAWLTSNIPPGIASIDILGTWETGSITVLVAVPVEIWAMIRPRHAYDFVSLYLGGFKQYAAPSQQPLFHAQRENIPPGQGFRGSGHTKSNSLPGPSSYGGVSAPRG